MKIRKFVVGREETNMSLVTLVYEDKKEFKDWIEAYMEEYSPTHLKIVRKMAVRNTPDGPLRTPVLIWQASWRHGEASRYPLFRPISAR